MKDVEIEGALEACNQKMGGANAPRKGDGGDLTQIRIDLKLHNSACCYDRVMRSQ